MLESCQSFKALEESQEKCIQEIEGKEEQVKALLDFSPEKVRQQFESLEKKLQSGQTLGSLAGVPIVVKDNICIKGSLTTCSSRMLENYVAPYDATVIERLKREDAVLIPRANMDEFAMGSSTENSAFQNTANPWDLKRVPGGSSGGSAAAVAAGYAPISLGSDTGGSIRQPASFCGLSSLKPSYGRISRFGLIAYASSFDQIGPLAFDCDTLEPVLKCLVGKDERDATTWDKPWETLAPEMPKRFLWDPSLLEGLDSEVAAYYQNLLEIFKDLRIEIIEHPLPDLKLMLACYYILAPAECSSNLSRFDGVRYGERKEEEGDSLHEMVARTRSLGFGQEVKRRILTGTYVLRSGYQDRYYLKAECARSFFQKQLETLMKEKDAVLFLPTTPTPAFPFDSKGSPLEMYLSDIFTVLANVTGLPSLTLQGPLLKGLPMGIQWIAPRLDDEKLIAYGRQFQKQTKFHLERPVDFSSSW